MKKLFSCSLIMMLALLTVTSSCKKSNDTTAPGGSGGLGTGKASIYFTNSGNFAGGTTFNVSNTAATQAASSAGTSRSIVLTATEISGTNSRTAGLILSVPASASTASGSLTGDFSNPNNAVILPSLTLSSTAGTGNGPAYISQSGTCTITKLTATEIEGSFSCVVKDTNGAGTLSLTSGTFAGKF